MLAAEPFIDTSKKVKFTALKLPGKLSAFAAGVY
jgi:hypothetical protein